MQGVMLSCLPWFSSGSTRNSTPNSGSTDLAGSTVSFSGVSVVIMHEWDVCISMMRWHENNMLWVNMDVTLYKGTQCNTCDRNNQHQCIMATKAKIRIKKHHLNRKYKTWNKFSTQRTSKQTHESWICNKINFLELLMSMTNFSYPKQNKSEMTCKLIWTNLRKLAQILGMNTKLTKLSSQFIIFLKIVTQ